MRGITGGACLALAGLLMVAGSGLRAQQDEGPEPPLTTLHLYANLVQVPVLVLNEHFEPMSPVPFDLFGVSVDSGKFFTPTRVRREGDDPISLAILLDVSGAEASLMKELPKVVAKWAAGSLLAHDRVSIYAIDCGALVAGPWQAGSQPGPIQMAVDLALSTKGVHGPTEKPACWKTKHLWDTLNLITARLGGEPGRRVLLAITDGRDGGSKWSWTDVRLRAASEAVTIFGMSESQVPYGPAMLPTRPAEDKFNLLCQLSGGIILPGQSHYAGEELKDFMKMVRNRYLLEFPRPKGLDVRQHTIEVTIRKRDAIIRPAGLSMTVETAEEKAPENQPTDPVAAPEAGTRRILTPHR